MRVLAQGVELLDACLVRVYLGAIAFLGWLGYQRTKTAADYMLAGRRAHPFIMAMSHGAGFMLPIAMVGLVGVAAVLMGGTEFLARTFAAPYGLALMVFGAITAVYVLYGVLKGRAVHGGCARLDHGDRDARAAGLGRCVGGRSSTRTRGSDSVEGGGRGLEGHRAPGVHEHAEVRVGQAGGSAGECAIAIDMWWIVVGTLVMGVAFTVGANSILSSYPNWPVVDPRLVVFFLSVVTIIMVSVTELPDPGRLARRFGGAGASSMGEGQAIRA